MTIKSILRFILGVVIAGMLLQLLLHAAGIPKSYLLPPPIVYDGAKGVTAGTITGKRAAQSPNPFRSGEKVYDIDYQFTAPAPPRIGGASAAGKPAKYTGSVRVDKCIHDQAIVGTILPIRYEATNPGINGVNAQWAGKRSGSGSSIVGTWLVWLLASVLLGFFISSLLERLLPRDDM